MRTVAALGFNAQKEMMTHVTSTDPHVIFFLFFFLQPQPSSSSKKIVAAAVDV
jgi:hypothetical protein